MVYIVTKYQISINDAAVVINHCEDTYIGKSTVAKSRNLNLKAFKDYVDTEIAKALI